MAFNGKFIDEEHFYSSGITSDDLFENRLTPFERNFLRFLSIFNYNCKVNSCAEVNKLQFRSRDIVSFVMTFPLNEWRTKTFVFWTNWDGVSFVWSEFSGFLLSFGMTELMITNQLRHSANEKVSYFSTTHDKWHAKNYTQHMNCVRCVPSRCGFCGSTHR